MLATPADSLTWRVNSPAESANTTPPAMTGGAGEFRSRETQTGVSTALPLCSSTLNATTEPFDVEPFTPWTLKSGCSGPHTAARTQRVPAASSQLDMAPQIP